MLQCSLFNHTPLISLTSHSFSLMATTATTFASPLLHHRHHYRRRPLRAAGGSDFNSSASTSALRDALKRANDALELFAFESRKAAERLDRRFSLSSRLDSARRAAAVRARELGVGQRWRAFSVDFSRNWPRYRKAMQEFMETPLGKSLGVIFLIWFVLSGWWFRFVVISLWVLPLAFPLLIGLFSTVAKKFVIQGGCPACRRQFAGYRNQVIRCTSCGNIVWQPSDDFSGGNGGRSGKSSEPNIIDI